VCHFVTLSNAKGLDQRKILRFAQNDRQTISIRFIAIRKKPGMETESKADSLSEIFQKVIYHGKVQGVGFRYTTRSIAKSFPVSGYVRNMPDGTVEMVASAEPNQLVAFQNEIAQRFSSNLTDIVVEECPNQEFKSRFEIRY